MRLLWNVCALAVDVVTSDRSEDLPRKMVLLLACLTMSLLLSSFLLLYLLLSLDYEASIVLAVVGSVATLLTFTLFASKRVRCFYALFLVSVLMKKSRNLLLAAGTSLVVLRNVGNTLENLTALVRSMTCNLRYKKDAIKAPFSGYIQMLEWLGSILRGVTDLGVLKLESSLKVSLGVKVEGLTERLEEAEQKLEESVRRVKTLVDAASSLGGRAFPALSFLLLLGFMALHVRRYRGDLKYQNRFIGRRFVEFDERQKLEGRTHVLPLTPRERKIYAVLPSARPGAGELKASVRFALPVFSHLSLWVFFIGLDSLFYLFVDIVTRRLSEVEPFKLPLIMSITEISTLMGLQVGENKHRKDFSYSVTLFEQQCLPEPKLLLHQSVAPLAAILLALSVMSVLASKLLQLRLLVCERFFGQIAQQRAEHLHAQILRMRRRRGGGEGGLRPEEEQRSSWRRRLCQPHFWSPLLFSARTGQNEVLPGDVVTPGDE